MPNYLPCPLPSWSLTSPHVILFQWWPASTWATTKWAVWLSKCRLQLQCRLLSNQGANYTANYWPTGKSHCQWLSNLGGNRNAKYCPTRAGCESQSRLLSNLGVNCTANFCPTRVRIAPPITVQLVGKSHWKLLSNPDVNRTTGYNPIQGQMAMTIIVQPGGKLHCWLLSISLPITVQPEPCSIKEVVYIPIWGCTIWPQLQFYKWNFELRS